MAENETEQRQAQAGSETVTRPAGRRSAASKGAAGAEGLERLTIALGDDGSLALDRMRPETQERLIAALKATPNAARKLGLTVPAEGTDKSTSADTAVLYGVVSKLLVVSAQASGYAPEDAGTLAFSADEIARLDEPTRKVLDKYNLFGRWSDEIGLAMLIGLTLSAKVQALPPRPRKPADVIQMRPVGVDRAEPTPATPES